MPDSFLFCVFFFCHHTGNTKTGLTRRRETDREQTSMQRSFLSLVFSSGVLRFKVHAQRARKQRNGQAGEHLSKNRAWRKNNISERRKKREREKKSAERWSEFTAGKRLNSKHNKREENFITGPSASQRSRRCLGCFPLETLAR